MTPVKLIFLSLLMIVLTGTTFGGLLDAIFIPTILQEKYQLMPTMEGYRLNLEEPDGSKREEVGMVINPGTPEEELVVMGTYSVYDEKTDTDTVTMYTADKDGYKPRYMLKNRKLSANTLKSMVG
ncbi:endocuticle structural glycoprotein SgAbd-9-like [Lucilia sericata]|uniref:endocuticle structural glycoprotein SgAbd-9-like n=1 Tax=Lucilia sericata TaxID=13632 RepID=UPI0018A7F29D|nr:endocuticle structural glycoprotein SgAbd-9-like [Lucilia sericata]